MHRRDYLLSVAGLTAVAGCTGSAMDSDDSSSGNPYRDTKNGLPVCNGDEALWVRDAVLAMGTDDGGWTGVRGKVENTFPGEKLVYFTVTFTDENGEHVANHEQPVRIPGGETESFELRYSGEGWARGTQFELDAEDTCHVE